ncbi:phosphoribosyltransferase [Clostridium magnum]|uniref:Putative phosphoribosyl transferasec n=1 Tax=Clostridium magnum DSM 2767 TaxID=1121326 RepID=A0A162R1K7_9CLOT|nr:phosphoribosyltransferase [Clostridium magnum]KZL89287.1 putative phosphoribosyl transferasec [Clostridium magnum DSM 2767]SHI95896.1 Predicted phosphoribosyltransferase [Clostridium magnum DSM 2767]
MFVDRKDAGEKLSVELEKFKDENPIVLAIPRGGIVAAYETIKKFGFQWDLIIPRKIGLPQNKEIAIGAVSLDGTYLLNEEHIDILNISQEYIEKEISEQIEEIKRRLNKYKGNENFPDVRNKTVIIIDDGIATGFTIQAAIKSIKEHDAKKIILAVPVAPQDTVSLLEKIVDEVICLLIPNEFYAVGLYYESFEQTTDEEVFNMVDELKKR